MLPQKYKFHVVNNTGEQLDGTGSDIARITTLGWKFNSLGALTYGAEATGLNVTTDVGPSGSTAAGSAQDNSSTLNLGLHGKFTVDFVAGTPTGSMHAFVEFPTDGSTFPSDAAEINVLRDLTSVGSIAFTGGPSEHSKNFIL